VTNSNGEPGTGQDRRHETRPGKRERLVEAAGRLFYQQGVERTTLADIAEAADITIGNLWYYFKAKEELVQAVVDAHVRDIEARLATLDQAAHTPQDRLKGLLDAITGHEEEISIHGCPYGTLVSEIGKRGDNTDPASARLLQLRADWSRQQFTAMGRPDADDLATELIARYQGVVLVAAAYRDPDLMRRQLQRIKDWIDAIGN
jgi:AcrR family transcriptional regulator